MTTTFLTDLLQGNVGLSQHRINLNKIVFQKHWETLETSDPRAGDWFCLGFFAHNAVSNRKQRKSGKTRAVQTFLQFESKTRG